MKTKRLPLPLDLLIFEQRIRRHHEDIKAKLDNQSFVSPSMKGVWHKNNPSTSKEGKEPA
jgi:hypothetical protein